MENKTALQLVIEELTTLKNEALELSKNDREKNRDYSINDAVYVTYSIAINVAKKKLEDEKNQIIKAYREGFWSDDVKLSSDYYNQKFN
jgi:hypothetical protein